MAPQNREDEFDQELGDDDEELAYLDDIAERYGFDECCSTAFVAVLSSYAAFLDGESIEDDLRTLAKAVAHGDVALGVGDALMGDDPELIEQRARFVDDLVDASSGAGRSGPLMLRAHLAMADGRVLEGEADLEAVVRVDPGWALANAELAELASIRGDAARVMRFLVAAGVPPDHEEVTYFKRYVVDAVEPVGRNQPCPCGSGRKFKQCHQGQQVAPPIEQRSGWLIKKVAAQVNSSRGTVGLASSAVTPWAEAPGEEFLDRFRAFTSDPFLTDLAMVEGGGLVEFLDTYDALLPADELAVAEAWAESPRRLWEVTAVDPDVGMMTLRDTGGGDPVVVSERAGSRSFGVGDLLLAIVVPVGGQQQFLSIVLPVDLRHRDGLMAVLDDLADADELAAWYGWTLAPPTLTNREGEAMRPQRWLVTPSVDWAAFAEALDEHFDPEETVSDDDGGWIDPVDLDGERIVRAFLRREGDDLLVEVNSDERWARIESILRSIAPDLEATALADQRPAPSGGDVFDTSPQAQAALRELILEREQLWLDEQIPALGGLTPREAVDDPTRREDLIALLRSFTPIDEPGRMSFDPDRLRAALGLDEE